MKMCHWTFPNYHTMSGVKRAGEESCALMCSAGLPRPAEGFSCLLSFTLETLLYFLCGQETGVHSLCCCRCRCYQSHWVSVDSPSPTPVSHEAGCDHKRTVSLVKLALRLLKQMQLRLSVPPLPRERDVQRSRQRSPRLWCSSVLLSISMLGLCRCESCGAVFHSECKEKSVPCPRCVRRELQKKQKSFWRQLNVDESLEEACTMFELCYQNT